MATTSDTFEIRSAAHGPHWIAWVDYRGAESSRGTVVLIGETREEAEARAREWIRSSYNTQVKK